MSKPLEILINASLKMDTINNQLKELSNKDINFGIDQNGISKIIKQVNQLQKQLNSNNGSIKIIDSESVNKELNKIDDQFRKLFANEKQAKEYFQQFGSVKVSTNIDPITKQLENFTLQVTKASGEIEKLKFNMAMIDGSNSPIYEMTNRNVTDNSDQIAEKQLQATQKVHQQVQDNIEKEQQAQQKAASNYEQWWLKALKNRELQEQTIIEREQELEQKAADNYVQWWQKALKTRQLQEIQAQEQATKDEQKLIEQMENFRIQSIANRERREREADAAQLQAIQRNMDLTRQETESETQKTIQLQHQISLYQQQAEINARSLNRQFGDNVDQNAMNAYLNSVRELNTETPEVRQRMQQLGVDFRSIREESLQSASQVSSFGNALKEAFTKFPIWIASSTVFFQSLKFVSDGIAYVNQLNQALTQISIVTGKNQQQVSALADQYNKLAYSMGVTTQDVANASVEFYRQGLNQAQVLDHVKVATEYAKISNLDLNTSAEILTATTNSMNVTMSHAADVFSYLGDATATGADEIGIAFQKVGGTAGALNLNFEKVASWIAVISSKTRESADTIGQSIKSILARFQSLKEKGFDSTDGTTVNQVAKALNAVGIQLMNTQGQFRNIGNVMDDLGKKWSSLDSRQKSYLATTLAGTYQQSRFLNLMSGYSQSVNLYEKSLNSAGTTQKKFNLYQQGTEAHLAKLKDVWAQVWQNTFNSQGLQRGIDALTSLATGIKNVTGTVGTLPVALGIATTALIAFNSSMRTSTLTTGSAFLTMLKGIPTGLRSMESALATTALKTRLLSGATNILTLSMKGLRAVAVTTLEFLGGAIFPVVGIMALTYGIQKLTGYLSNLHTQQIQQQNQVDKLTNSYAKNASQINNHITQYKKLSGEVIDSNGKIDQNNKNYQSYLEVQTKLGQLMPSLISYTDANGQAHLKSAKNIDTEVSSLKTLTEAKQKLNDVKVTDDITNYAKSLQKAVSDLKTAKVLYGMDLTPNTGFDTVSGQGADAKQKAQDYVDLANAQYQYQVALSQGVTFTQQQASAYLDASKAGKDLTSADKNLINVFVEQNKKQLDLTHGQQNAIDSIDRLATKTADYGKVIASIRDLLGKSANLNFLGNYNESQNNVLPDLIKSYKDGSLTLDEFTKRLSANGFAAKDQSKILNDLSGANNKNTDATKKQIDATTELTTILKNASSVQDYISKQVTGYTSTEIDQQTQLIQLYNSLSKQSEIYGEVKKKLIALFPDELKGTNLSIQGMMNEVDARKVMSQAAVDSASNRMSAEEQVTFNLAKNLQKQEQIIKAMIKNYEALMMSAVTVDPKNGAVAMDGVAMYWYNKMKAEESQLSTVSDSYISTTAKLAKQMNYSVPYATPQFSGSSSGGSSKSKKGSSGSGSSSTPVAQYQTDKYQQSLDALDEKIKEVDASTANMDKTSKKYIDALKEEISLTKDKEKVVNSEISSLEKRDKAIQKQLKSMGSFNKLSNSQKQTYNQLAQELDQNTQKINQLKDANIGYANDIASINDKIKQSYSDLADQIVQIEKDAYEKERQIALDANKKQMDDLDKQHTQIMQNYDDEMTKYQDVIDQKTKALDKASSDRSYNEDLAAKQKAAQDTLNQINVMKLDTSPEGQAKLADLQKQYAQEQQDIQDTTYQHGVDLQKQNLQDQATSYQKDIDAKKNAEDAKYNAAKDELQKEQDAINKYYDNIANDDRKWAKLHQDIMNGHFDQVKKDFASFTKILKGHMEELGQSITQNLIDNIDAASKAMANLTGASTPPSSKPSSGSSSHPTSSGSGHKSSGSSHSGSSSNKKKNRYYTVEKGDTLSEIAQKYYGHGTKSYYDKIAKANHISNPDEIKIGERLLIPYDTGGYTGTFNGGRIALLHQKELVLNKDDTSNMLKMVNLVRDLIPKINFPDLNGLANKLGNTIHMPITIQNLNGGKEGADELFRIVGNQFQIMGVK